MKRRRTVLAAAAGGIAAYIGVQHYVVSNACSRIEERHQQELERCHPLLFVRGTSMIAGNRRVLSIGDLEGFSPVTNWFLFPIEEYAGEPPYRSPHLIHRRRSDGTITSEEFPPYAY
jgi:hypothetical protein